MRPVFVSLIGSLFVLGVACSDDAGRDDGDDDQGGNSADTSAGDTAVQDDPGAGGDTSDGGSGDMVEEVAEDVGEEVAEDAVEEVAEDAAGDAGEEVAEDAGGDMAGDAADGGDVADAVDASDVADAGDSTSDSDTASDVADEEVAGRTTIVGGSDCASAVALTEGSYRIATAGLTNDQGAVRAGAHSLCKSKLNDGVDTVFEITIPGRSAFQVHLEASSEFIYAVAVPDCTDYATDECSTEGTGVASEFNPSESAVTRLLVIDSLASEALTGDILLDLEYIHEGDFAVGQTCDAPIVLSGTGTHSINADPTQYINRYGLYTTMIPLDDYLSGRDVVYQITVPAGWEVVNDWHGSGRFTTFADVCNDVVFGQFRRFFNENLVRNTTDSEVVLFYVVDGFDHPTDTYNFSITIRETTG